MIIPLRIWKGLDVVLPQLETEDLRSLVLVCRDTAGLVRPELFRTIRLIDVIHVRSPMMRTMLGGWRFAHLVRFVQLPSLSLLVLISAH